MRRGISGWNIPERVCHFPAIFVPYPAIADAPHLRVPLIQYPARRTKMMTRTRMIAAELFAQVALATAVGVCVSIVLAGAALLLAGGAPA
jgi:hypothetical protein